LKDIQRHRYTRTRSEILIFNRFPILLSIELSLWEKVPGKKPDLKHITLAYILDTPRRYHLEMIADQFLNMILPIKLEEELG
jgi:hypothetical protein